MMYLCWSMFGSTRRLVVLYFQFEGHFGTLVVVVGVLWCILQDSVFVSLNIAPLGRFLQFAGFP
jgi:hypothetical protein